MGCRGLAAVTETIEARNDINDDDLGSNQKIGRVLWLAGSARFERRRVGG